MEFNFVLLALAAIITLHILSTEATKEGFSIEIISRDSPKSPFYNPDETATQRIANAIRRSTNRVRHFNLRLSNSASVTPQTPESVITGEVGEYLMNISVGTPSFEIVAIADTGSDLIWTQCEPCERCFKQNAPLFDPSSSSTYRDISCSAKQCSILERTGCSGSGSGSSGICQYQYSYGDSSSTIGNVAVETLTLGSTSGRPVPIPKALFGCGHQNSGTFSASSSGIVGLGGGPVSLITQLGPTIGGKFSYCLVPATSRGTKTASTLNFGSNAVVSGTGVQSTPLVSKDPDTFYFLTLEAISVGTKRIEFTGSSFGTSSGNIIIDSGTTLTLVPQDFYTDLASEVENQVTGGTKIDDPNNFLKLCYQGSSDLNVPKITVHFSGADVELKPLNTFIRVSESVICFTFNPTESGAIYGNLAQMDFLVGYDLQEKTVSFKPTDCARSTN